MLRVISAVVVESLVSATAVPPAPAEALPAAHLAAPADPVDALHQTGEQLFDAGDYAGARVAWTEAYERVEADGDTWPYRATLLSLIVTATLSEFSESGDRAAVRAAAELVDAALAVDLDEELRASLQEERERLSPYLDPVPSPDETQPRQDVGLTDARSQDSSTRSDLVPAPIWAGAGGVLLAGGVAAVIVGSRFGPRATEQVISAGDSTSMAPGSTFIGDERRKGTGWMVSGGVIAAVGVAALVIGIVRLARERR